MGRPGNGFNEYENKGMVVWRSKQVDSPPPTSLSLSPTEKIRLMLEVDQEDDRFLSTRTRMKGRQWKEDRECRIRKKVQTPSERRWKRNGFADQNRKDLDTEEKRSRRKQSHPKRGWGAIWARPDWVERRKRWWWSLFERSRGESPVQVKHVRSARRKRDREDENQVDQLVKEEEEKAAKRTKRTGKNGSRLSSNGCNKRIEERIKYRKERRRAWQAGRQAKRAEQTDRPTENNDDGRRKWRWAVLERKWAKRSNGLEREIGKTVAEDERHIVCVCEPAVVMVVAKQRWTRIEKQIKCERK